MNAAAWGAAKKTPPTLMGQLFHLNSAAPLQHPGVLRAARVGAVAEPVDVPVMNVGILSEPEGRALFSS